MAKTKALDVFDVLHAIFYFYDKSENNSDYKASTSDLMRLLKVTDRTLRRYKESGKLQPISSAKGINGQDVFPVNEVLTFLEDLLSGYEEKHGINLFEDTLKD